VCPKNLQLQGYSSQSNNSGSGSDCEQTQLGLGLGGIIALVFTGIGGMWLTQQVLKPTEQSFQRLKQFTADASHELQSPDSN